MKKCYLALFIILFSLPALLAFSQVSKGGLPLSIQFPAKFSGPIDVKVMPQVDVLRLMAEDSANDYNKEIPWRFGENIVVSLDLNNSGTWSNLPEGDKLWQLGIRCPHAYTINLNFDNYRVPPGATLFVYNIDKTQIIGAFTDFNNRADRVFATTLLTGEEIVIEYHEPANPAFPGELHLNQVTHGYRNIMGYIRGLGMSGACNNNVRCPRADAWQNQVRSVCMLVTGGGGLCSGVLINNTSQDGTPYILTANHCYNNPSSWVFWFNWQSATCLNPLSAPSYSSISGATLKARFSDTDFCLVQMSSIPPVSDSVYYAGWNKQDFPADSGVCIHHPMGDIKKISYSGSPFVSSSWSGKLADSHWQVFWSDGVTEPGSSGSPIFDQHHFVVGQLEGGPSGCDATQLYDKFGKFSMSWDHGTTSETRLRDWLDPTNIARDTLPGYDPTLSPEVQTLPATDVAITTAALSALITTNGRVTNYLFDWGTTTAFGNTTPPTPAGSGFTPVSVSAPLTGLMPETTYYFQALGTTSSGTYWGDTLTFKTGALPSLLVSPPYQNVGPAPEFTHFIVTSNVPWNAASGAGWCTVTPSGTGNDTIHVACSENTTHQERSASISVTATGVPTQTVTVTQSKSTLGIENTAGNHICIFPNPTTGIFRLVAEKGYHGTLDLRVADLRGCIILDKTFADKNDDTIDLSWASGGSYFITIWTDTDVVVRKLVILK